MLWTGATSLRTKRCNCTTKMTIVLPARCWQRCRTLPAENLLEDAGGGMLRSPFLEGWGRRHPSGASRCGGVLRSLSANVPAHLMTSSHRKGAELHYPFFKGAPAATFTKTISSVRAGRNPPLATDNLLENAGGGSEHPPSLFSRGGQPAAFYLC